MALTAVMELAPAPVDELTLVLMPLLELVRVLHPHDRLLLVPWLLVLLMVPLQVLQALLLVPLQELLHDEIQVPLQEALHDEIQVLVQEALRALTSVMAQQSPPYPHRLHSKEPPHLRHYAPLSLAYAHPPVPQYSAAADADAEGVAVHFPLSLQSSLEYFHHSLFPKHAEQHKTSRRQHFA